MALKHIIGLSSLAALAGTSFSSPVALGVRQYIPTGGSSSWTNVTTTWSNLHTIYATVFSSTASSCSESSSTPTNSILPSTLRSTSSTSRSIGSSTSLLSSVSTSMSVPNTTTSSSGPIRLSTSNTVSLSTVSYSLISIRPCRSASFIVQTLTEPGVSFAALTVPTSTSITALETLTISGSILTVESITAASSISVPLIVETLTEPNGPVVTLTLPTSASVTGLETLTISDSTLTVEPVTVALSRSASLIVETLTEPNRPVVTLRVPANTSVTGLETITVSSSILTVEPTTAASSISVPSIVETLTEPNGPVVTVTLPAIASITGLETLTISSATLTVDPISITSNVLSTPSPSTLNVQTFTKPDGSAVVLTLAPGSTLTGLQTVTTDRQTLTIQPIPTPTTSVTITATITTVPAGLSIEPYTDTPVTGNMWLTTTGSDHSTTIVPIILPCPTCEPKIIWNLPEVPNVEFNWPTLPQLPKFHLPCVKIFGITIAGSCPDSSGPTPQNDAPPKSPEHSTPPTSSPSSGSSSSSSSFSSSSSSSSSGSSSSSSSSACSATLSVSVAPSQLTAPTVTLSSMLGSGSSSTARQRSSTSGNTGTSSSLSSTTLPSSTVSPSSTPSSTTSPSLTTSSSLPPLPKLTFSSTPAITTVEPFATESGSSCVSTSTTTICKIPREPCISSAVCNSWIATATPTPTPTSTLPSPPTPTGQVYIDIFTDSDCINVLEQTQLNAIGQCYSPTDSSGNPISFKCFSITYISTAASHSASLSAFKGPGCFSQDDSKVINYANLTTIDYHNEKPFTMGSLSLYGT